MDLNITNLNTELRNQIGELINSTQQSAASHPKIIAKLQKLYNDNNQDEFFQVFISIIQNIMVSIQKHPYIDRVIEFIAKFSVSLGSDSTSEMQQANNNSTTVNNNDSQMTTSIDEVENYFLVNLINYLLKTQRANSDAVRYRSCQILAKIMSSINNQQFIEEDLFDKLTDAMIERLKDINSRVQVQAISAIFRLQDPNDKNCGVIKALIYLINHDPNWQVRFQALSNVAFSKQTLPHIIDRVRDSHPIVRRKALFILSEKVLIKYITIEKRLFILNYSLKDDDSSVLETCCKKLLPSWLAFKENNMIKLLKALDVIKASDLCELMLDNLYKEESIEFLIRDFGLINEENNLINMNNLDAESVFYWKWLCNKCKKELTLDDYRDKLLPSLTEYCDYLVNVLSTIKDYDNEIINDDVDETSNHLKRLENTFVVKNLIKMMTFLDFSDSHGKKSAIQLCQDILKNHKYSFLFDEIMLIYRLFVPQIQTRVKEIVEIISDISNPDENETRIDDENLNETLEQEHQVQEHVPKMSLFELQKKLGDVKFERMQIQIRLEAIYDELKKTGANPDLNELAENRSKLKVLQDQEIELDQQIKQYQNMEIAPATVVTSAQQQQQQKQQKRRTQNKLPREEADQFTIQYHCLKLTICILEDTELKKETPELRSIFDCLIVKNLSSQDESLRLLSLRALNLFCILSLSTAKKFVPVLTQAIRHDRPENVCEAFKCLINFIMTFSLDKLVDGDNQLTTEILSVMTPMIDHEDADLRLLAVEGFCKLFMTGHLISPKLFSKLLIMYYSPLSEHEKQLRATLAYFLPQFAFLKVTNQNCVEESFMMTIKCLINAPPDSYLSQIDINKVIENLLHLTNPKNLFRKTNQRQVVIQNSCHENIGKAVCLEILREENTFKHRIYVKILQTLDLSQADYNSLKELKKYAIDAEDQITDKLLRKTMMKFIDTLKEAITKKPEYQNETNTSTRTSGDNTLVQQKKNEDNHEESLNQSDMIDHDFVKIKKKTKTNSTTINNKTIDTTSNVSTIDDLSKSLKDCQVRVDRLDEQSIRRSVRTLDRQQQKQNETQNESNVTITNENETDTTQKSNETQMRRSSPRIQNKVLSSICNQSSSSEKRPRKNAETISKKSKTTKSTKQTKSSTLSTSSATEEEEPPQKIRRSSRTTSKTNNKSTEKSLSPIRRTSRRNIK